ncbi:uncharacterized protein BHQ10_009941 [Talaromyces amestolkiae]|uniref:Uncharacterized protein n=1 Tax=Talaromyces amestolkiae TaxID=1196081 RepID=A0A364LDT2_TALAM|nr:uncharacterized protein BHQ10_009941 [Talaromyces amestolkiae]RAO73929.1 hypothetical protein BHQ10_009941 [Talaromyces amestolkiae]
MSACRALEADIVSEFSFGEAIGAVDAWHDRKELDMVSANDEIATWMPLLTNFPGLFGALSSLRYILKKTTGCQIPDSRHLQDFRGWAEKTCRSALLEKTPYNHNLIHTLTRSGLPLKTALSEAKENLGPGTDTTSATLAHIIWALSHNLQFQGRLFQDLQNIRFSSAISDLEAVPRLRACVKEGIRWTGAAAVMLPRIVPQGGIELHGKFIPEGVILSSSPIWYLRDAIAFPNPKDFDPYRWLTPDGLEFSHNQLRDKFYIPFSKGGNTCIGAQFAYAVPVFGQYLLAGVPLPAVNITLSNPGNSTIEFAVTSNITVPDKFKINLQPATISFFQNGPDPGSSPFATVDLPETTWYSREKVGVVNQTLQLKNLTEFTKLIQQVAYYPTFKVSGRTRAKVHVGPINTWVDLYKLVELTGFDVRQIGIQKPDADGNDVYGEVVVYNPSPASVTLGDVTLDVLIGDVVVGQASTTVNNIVPGNNTFEIRGKLNSTAVLNDTLALVKTELPYFEQELVVASARGRSVVYDGQHLPYWEDAFQLLRITATKPVLPLLNALVNSTADELLGDNQFASPALNFLVDLLIRLLKSIPPQEEAGFEQVVSEVAAIAVKIFQGLGLL